MQDRHVTSGETLQLLLRDDTGRAMRVRCWSGMAIEVRPCRDGAAVLVHKIANVPAAHPRAKKALAEIGAAVVQATLLDRTSMIDAVTTR
jgi:hypothetical protein